MTEPSGKGFQIISPGRVNLIGEHVDYNDGVVLPAAIDREIKMQVRPLAEPLLILHALDLGKSSSLALDDLDARQDLQGNPLQTYALYPAGVAWALQKAGLSSPGMEVSYSSSIPIGAGLSSSAAVQVGFALAWQELGGWELDPMRLVQLCQRSENQFIGVQSGLMDQFAVRFGVAEHALRFDTRSLAWQPVALPPETSLVIADSRVRRSLTTSAYNERRADCEIAVSTIREQFPQVQALRDVTPAMLAANKAVLSPQVYARAQHVVEEIARVDDAIACLAMGNEVGFGQLMFASHFSLRDLYEVSCPELDILVEIAAGLPGCLGARLTGAGFGGCTVNLVESDAAANFTAKLGEAYLARTGHEASIYVCHAAQGARVLW